MSNLSLLSAVAGVGMADPFSDSGIPSRRIYTLTERTAAAWSKFLDRAAAGGDPYTLTERSGALEAARAFLDSIPLDRLSRVRKATVTKLIRHLESPMHRKHNPTSNPSGKIVLPFKRGSGPAASVAELLQKAAAQRGEPISAKEAATRAKGFQQGLLVDAAMLKPLKQYRASSSPLLGWMSGPLVIFDASHYIRIPGFGYYVPTPEGGAVPGDILNRTVAHFKLDGFRFADPDGTLHDDEDRLLGRTGNPTSSTLQVIRQYLPNAARRGAAYAGSVGEGAAKRSIWVEPAGRSATVKVYRYADPRIDNTLSAHVLESEYSGDLATVVLRAVQVAEATIAEHAGTRTGNPRRPKLVWEFDGEPTSPAALLSNNSGNGDVAAAVKYLAAEGAKFVASARSWAAVSFGGGAADESYLTVRADWTAGPVFAAVLDASVIPYAGDLPDAD